jgi:hypothetical protein
MSKVFSYYDENDRVYKRSFGQWQIGTRFLESAFPFYIRVKTLKREKGRNRTKWVIYVYDICIIVHF